MMHHKETLTIGLCGGSRGVQGRFFCCLQGMGFSLRASDTMTLRFDGERNMETGYLNNSILNLDSGWAKFDNELFDLEWLLTVPPKLPICYTYGSRWSLKFVSMRLRSFVSIS